MEETLHSDMTLLAEQQPAFMLVGLIACGLLCCFFGYRTTNLLISLSGFILFGMLAMLLAGFVTEGNLLYMGLGLLVGGLIGALLAYGVYRLGIMVLGSGVSALIMWHFSSSLPSEQWLLPAIILAALLGGIMSLLLQHVLISLATAILGGLMTVHGVFLLLSQFEITPFLPDTLGSYSHIALFTLSWLCLTVVGFLFQLLFDKDRKKRIQT